MKYGKPYWSRPNPCSIQWYPHSLEQPKRDLPTIAEISHSCTAIRVPENTLTSEAGYPFVQTSTCQHRNRISYGEQAWVQISCRISIDWFDIMNPSFGSDIHP